MRTFLHFAPSFLWSFARNHLVSFTFQSNRFVFVCGPGCNICHSDDNTMELNPSKEISQLSWTNTNLCENLSKRLPEDLSDRLYRLRTIESRVALTKGVPREESYFAFWTSQLLFGLVDLPVFARNFLIILRVRLCLLPTSKCQMSFCHREILFNPCVCLVPELKPFEVTTEK